MAEFKTVKDIEDKYGQSIIATDNKDCVLDIFNGNIDMERIMKDSKLMCELAWYYENKKNYRLAEKYYLLAIKCGCVKAMYLYGIFVQYVKMDYKMALKYINLSIENGSSDGMNSLGYSYDMNKNYELAEKYYLMAIDNGSIVALNNLGIHYEDVGKYDLAEKYLLKSIEKGEVISMYALGDMYYSVHNNRRVGLQYFKMAIENGYDVKRIIGDVSSEYIGDLQMYYYLGVNSSDRDVNIFKNKCNILGKKMECNICDNNNVLCIPFECAHYVCCDCYIEIIATQIECPYCRTIL